MRHLNTTTLLIFMGLLIFVAVTFSHAYQSGKFHNKSVALAQTACTDPRYPVLCGNTCWAATNDLGEQTVCCYNEPNLGCVVGYPYRCGPEKNKLSPVSCDQAIICGGEYYNPATTQCCINDPSKACVKGYPYTCNGLNYLYFCNGVCSMSPCGSRISSNPPVTPAPTKVVPTGTSSTQPTQSTTSQSADFNNDGKVDLLDFNIWRTGFLGSGGVINTPTPSRQ